MCGCKSRIPNLVTPLKPSPKISVQAVFDIDGVRSRLGWGKQEWNVDPRMSINCIAYVGYHRSRQAAHQCRLVDAPHVIERIVRRGIEITKADIYGSTVCVVSGIIVERWNIK